MSEETVQLYINDQQVSALKSAMIIEVADQHGIDIPRFCYHKKLSVAANCRMCMVEVEKAPKPLPACATPVVEGMKVYTKSPAALDAQKGTMEFLLINHPLDCPVCDQGGECELQDVAIGYGRDISRYIERKRVVPDKELGPLVSTDMTRCIHCTRCIRFSSEIAGVRELGATGRGEFMEIGTYVERSLSSELSGNVIDVCPVGALNAKPSRMTARSWEMLQSPSISPHDSVGSNIYMHSLRNQIMRVVPREHEELNETWISDRDRFSYEALIDSERVKTPILKDEQGWQKKDWETCIEQVASIIKSIPAEDIGVLISPHSTLEELYLLQKVFRHLNVQNIDHRTRQIDFTDQEVMPLFPYLGQSIQSIEKNDVTFLIGSDIRTEQPMLAHRMRKAASTGGIVASLNPKQFDFYFKNQKSWTLEPQEWVNALAKIVKCASSVELKKLPNELSDLVANVSITADARNIYELLINSDKTSVLLGALTESHPQSSVIRALANFIANITGSNFGIIAQSGNTAGAWLSGAIPHRLPAGIESYKKGLNSNEMLEKKRRLYILFNLEPEFDFINAPVAIKAMQEAEYVVSFSPYITDHMKEYADAILPIATFAETDGTYINAEGRWQSVNKSISAPDESRSAWRVLRVLANRLGIDDIKYQTCSEITKEIKSKFDEKINFDSKLCDLSKVNIFSQKADLYRVSSTPIYATDNIVRRASSLQSTVHELLPHVAMCEQQAQDLGVLEESKVRIKQDQEEIALSLQINESVPMNCIWIQRSANQVDQLGSAIAPVKVERLSSA